MLPQPAASARRLGQDHDWLGR